MRIADGVYDIIKSNVCHYWVPEMLAIVGLTIMIKLVQITVNEARYNTRSAALSDYTLDSVVVTSTNIRAYSLIPYIGWTQKVPPPHCDFCWYFSRECKFLHDILRDCQDNQPYTLSLRLIEIHRKMKKICCFSQDIPPFSVCERHAELTECERVHW